MIVFNWENEFDEMIAFNWEREFDAFLCYAFTIEKIKPKKHLGGVLELTNVDLSYYVIESTWL